MLFKFYLDSAIFILSYFSSQEAGLEGGGGGGVIYNPGLLKLFQ